MPKTLKSGDKLNTKVIDGLPAMKVEVFAVSGDLHCDDDKHCACHGGGPFYCCRCGTSFTIVEEASR